MAEFAANGASIKEIVRRTGRSRKLVRLIMLGQRTDMFHTRQGSLDPHLPFLNAKWESGCRSRNGAKLWHRLRTLSSVDRPVSSRKGRRDNAAPNA